jgi:hypothetical protein
VRLLRLDLNLDLGDLGLFLNQADLQHLLLHRFLHLLHNQLLHLWFLGHNPVTTHPLLLLKLLLLRFHWGHLIDLGKGQEFGRDIRRLLRNLLIVHYLLERRQLQMMIEYGLVYHGQDILLKLQKLRRLLANLDEFLLV